MKKTREGRYKVLEHTADLALRIYGKDLKELFANAGYALFDVLTDISRVEEKTERRVELEALDMEQLLVKWLNELLYFHDVEGLLFRRFNIEALEDACPEAGRRKGLRANAYGETFREGHHIIITPLKAVTHHHLEVKKGPRGWQARVIVDL